jgi:hypothetical protein
MKKLLLLIAVLCGFNTIFAAPVDQAAALKAGANFLQSVTYSAAKTTDLSLAYTSVSASNSMNFFYVFNGNHSFVIVAADDRCTPVLGYSDEVSFNTGTLAPDVAYLFNTYTSQISNIIYNNVPATAQISNTWTELMTGTKPMQKSATLVGAMLKTTWDQVPYYNDLCPYDNSTGAHTVTGCVATAMAQVLRYWKYPQSGIGSYSYYDNQYGQLFASFSNTSYGWNDMPNSLSTSNSDVATLMLQCGISVGMSYGPATGTGSAAYVIYDNGRTPVCAENALKNYFGYAKSLKGLKRSDYTDAAWITLLETELSAHRPIIYAGFETGGAGHCFVFDGFNSAHPYFHINWGWGGAYNGFFAIDALNPGGVGTGGGNGNFNSGQQAIIGIQPADPSLAGIQNITENERINIYPNPAKDMVTVSLPQSAAKVLQVSLTDIQGREVYSIIPQDSRNITLSTSNIPDGIYSVRVLSDAGVLNTRLVIQK